MEKSMLQHAGFMTGLSKRAVDGMIEFARLCARIAWAAASISGQ
jgi:hypothetical protein